MSEETVEIVERVYRPKTVVYVETLTFPEFINHLGAVIIDRSGHMVGGPDRRNTPLQEKWLTWQRCIKIAAGEPGAVPGRVMDFFQATKHLGRPPLPSDLNIAQTGPIDKSLIVSVEALKEAYPTENLQQFIPTQEPTQMAKPPRFTWSFTSMNEYLTCPAQWAAKRFFKTLTDVRNEAMLIGEMIHETAEHYLKSKIGASHDLTKINGDYLPLVQRYCDALLASGAELFIEHEMCFTAQFKACGWKDWDTVWYRGKGDVLAKKLPRLVIFDWKSGKYKEDFLQLKMFAIFSALSPGFEDVQEFDPRFIFLKEKDPKKAILKLAQPIKRSDLKGILLNEILPVVRRMEESWANQNFPAKKNGLCKNYCANTACPHCGGR